MNEVTTTPKNEGQLQATLSKSTKLRMSKSEKKLIRKRKAVLKSVKEFIRKMDKMHLEFVTPIPTLIEELCEFDGPPSWYATQFRRIKTETHPEYTHLQPVQIYNVLNGNTKIWPKNEKKARQLEFHAHNTPRGVDVHGNKETARTYTLFQLFPVIKAMFDFSETNRGSLADMIATLKSNSEINFGLQIATAIRKLNGQCDFGKDAAKMLEYIQKKLVIQLIGMVGDKVACVYMIPPTPEVEAKFGEFKKSAHIVTTILGKVETKSEVSKYLENFRYIHKDFKKGVKGVFKDLDEWKTDFMNLYNNYPYIVNTSEYLTSLFYGKTHCTEWAGNTSFETHVAKILNIKQKWIHGQRGDVILELSNGSTLRDERKTLGVVHSGATSWSVDLRLRGQRGLDPLIVRLITATVRSDRSKTCPSNPNDFIALVLLCVITASGDLALRPNDPAARHLSMSCDIANRDEYVEFVADKIDASMYPEHMRETYKSGSTIKTKLKAVFYYDQLTPGSERLNELQELYKTFAERTPNANAIQAYRMAVNDELINTEKNNMKKSK